MFVDGGVRRGTDVFKALALGAKAVGIGRPFLWGLGAFGQAGVDRVLEILQGELKLVMGNCGTQTVAAIDRSYVATPDWHSDLWLPCRTNPKLTPFKEIVEQISRDAQSIMRCRSDIVNRRDLTSKRSPKILAALDCLFGHTAANHGRRHTANRDPDIHHPGAIHPRRRRKAYLGNRLRFSESPTFR